MDFREEFQNIMKDQKEIALATSIDNIPNVRIVNFYYSKQSKKIFFASFQQSKKVEEFRVNERVAFTTIPYIEEKHIRGKGIVKESEISIYDIKSEIVDKIPSYEETINEYGKFLILFEINLDEVDVIVDIENKDRILI